MGVREDGKVRYRAADRMALAVLRILKRKPVGHHDAGIQHDRLKKKLDPKHASDEPLTTDTFLVLAYQTGLKREDMDHMTIGDVIDYIYEWIDFNDTDKKKDHDEPRKATQADINAFLGGC